LAANNSLTPPTLSHGESLGIFAGPQATNPFFFSVAATPYLPDTLGGPSVAGIVSESAGYVGQSQLDSLIATLPVGKFPVSIGSIASSFIGYDEVFVSNLTASSISNLSLSIAGVGTSGTGTLGPGQSWTTLVPTGETQGTIRLSYNLCQAISTAGSGSTFIAGTALPQSATANASNSQSIFGPALTAPVVQNVSYANLASTAMETSGSGGYNLIDSTATILAGNNSSNSAQTVSMAWRTETLSERVSPALVSDVVDLSGMTLSGTSGQTSPFVLQMSYNPTLLPGGSGNEALWAAYKRIYLGWLDPATDIWENAIDGDFGTNLGTFYDAPWQSGDMTLGDWGVNTANHTVWAVIDHNSQFAVIPEPSSLALMAVGAMSLLGCRFVRRRAIAVARPARFGCGDAPAILSFPSQQPLRKTAMRKAA
jgi:hypothetical protein